MFDDVVAAGVPALSLGSGTRQAPAALARLVRIMRRFRPHVVITRGLNADILGRVAATIARVPVVVVWKHNTGHISRSALEVVSEKALDPFTDRYFAVAEGQVPYLTGELGWPERKIRVIHNGVDPAAFPYAAERRRDPALAAELGIARRRPGGRHPGRLPAGEGPRDLPARGPRRGRPRPERPLPAGRRRPRPRGSRGPDARARARGPRHLRRPRARTSPRSSA